MNSHRIIDSNSGSGSFTSNSDIDLPKQNFSAILNNPLSKNYLSKLKQKIKKPNVNIKNDYKKETLKFSIIDIFQGDNFEKEQNNKENKKEVKNIKKHKKKKSAKEKDDNSTAVSENIIQNKKTFQIKDYLTKNYDEYLSLLKHEYSSFLFNHYNKIALENTSLQEIKEEINPKVYISNSKDTFNKIEPIFTIDERIYKIDEKLLELTPSKLQIKISKLIEEAGIIELELERTNEYNHIIRNYINNLHPILIGNIHSIYQVVKNLKMKNESIKKNFIKVSSKLILKKQKQKKLKKIKFYLEQIKEFYDIFNNKDINNLDKASEIINLIPKINIIKELRNKIDLLIASKNDSMIEEIEKLIIDALNNLFTIDKGENYKINNNKLFDDIINFRKNIKGIDINLKINDINFNEIKNKFYSFSFNEYLQNKLIDRFIEINYDNLKMNFSKIQSLKNKNEVLYIFYISQLYQNQIELMNNIFNIKEDNNFYNNLKTKLLEKLNPLLSQNINYVFEEINNYLSNVTDFLIKNHLIKEIFSSNLLKNNSNISQKIEEYEDKFIKEYSQSKENKLKEGIKFDNFIPLDKIPYTYQIYINKIYEFDISKVGSYEENIQFFDIVIDKEKENQEFNLLQFSNSIQIKIIPTSLDIITYTFETLKMLSSFSINNYSKILNSLFAILKLYCNLNKEIVIESKGHLPSITQNELSISYSNNILIKQLVTIIYNNDKNKFLNQFSGGIFEKLYNEINIMIEENFKNLKSKINQLTQESIQICLQKFNNIVLGKNYPIVNNPNLPINDFALTLIKYVKAIYRDSLNSFDLEFIKEMLKNNLDNFSNEIEKKINGYIIENDDEKKQFKKDFVFIKKNIDNNIEDLNLENFKNKITIISKKFSPKEKKKGKKHKEKENEEKEEEK